jgi:hypothetical protein
MDAELQSYKALAHTFNEGLLNYRRDVMLASRKYPLACSGVTACSIAITRSPSYHSPNSLDSSIFLCIHFLGPLSRAVL